MTYIYILFYIIVKNGTPLWINQGFINPGNSAPWTRPLRDSKTSAFDKGRIPSLWIPWPSNGNNLTRQTWPKRLARSRQLPEINVRMNMQVTHVRSMGEIRAIWSWLAFHTWTTIYLVVLSEIQVVAMPQVLRFLVRTCSGCWYNQKGKESPSVILCSGARQRGDEGAPVAAQSRLRGDDFSTPKNIIKHQPCSMPWVSLVTNPSSHIHSCLHRIRGILSLWIDLASRPNFRLRTSASSDPVNGPQHDECTLDVGCSFAIPGINTQLPGSLLQGVVEHAELVSLLHLFEAHEL